MKSGVLMQVTKVLFWGFKNEWNNKHAVLFYLKNEQA